MTTQLYQYRIYCIEEAIFAYVWASDTPTLCPNNHADRTIDTNQTVIISRTGNNYVIAGQDTLKNFQHTCVPMNVPAMTPGTIYTHTFSWPMTIQIWKTEFYTGTEHLNDRFTIFVAPDTVVGVLTLPASIGATTITVSPTAVTNQLISCGIDIELDDGVNSENPGRITAFDTTLNTITFETPLTQAFLATTSVKLNMKVVNDIVLHRTGFVYKIGEKGLKGKTIPANTPLRGEYTNMDGQAKTLYVVIEIYYE